MKPHRPRRTLAVAVAAVALVVTGGAALAASQGSATSPSAFFDSVAKHLGISSEKLAEATKAASLEQVDAALKEGLITKEQADDLRSRIESGTGRGFGFGLGFRGGFHGGLHAGASLSAAADFLGLTVAELREKLADGDSLADVAKAEGKSVDGLQKALLADAKEKLDTAVKDERLTQAQADAALERLESRLDDVVNGTFDGRFGRGFGGGRFFGPPHAGAPLREAPIQ